MAAIVTDVRWYLIVVLQITKFCSFLWRVMFHCINVPFLLNKYQLVDNYKANLHKFSIDIKKNNLLFNKDKAYIYIKTCMSVYACVYIHKYTFIHVCLSVYIYIYIYI